LELLLYTLYLCATIGLLIGLGFGLRSRKHPFDSTFTGALIGAAIGAFIALFASLAAPKHDLPTAPKLLVAMRTAESTRDVIIWASDATSHEVDYNFLYKIADGSIAPGQVKVDSQVRIVEDPSLKSVGYWRTTYRTYDLSWAGSHWVFHPDTPTVVEQAFRVPAGAVRQIAKIK
jgi:hypothetical protein